MSDEEKLELDHEYGYTRTPNIILESLALTDINATQYRLCLYLVRMTYGWNRSEAPIALSEFASATHAAKEYVSRLMAGLLRKNIIARSESRWPGEGMVYQFNNPAEWDYGSVWQEVVHNQQKGLYRFHRRRRFRRRSALMHHQLEDGPAPRINSGLPPDNSIIIGQQLCDCTTRELRDCSTHELHKSTTINQGITPVDKPIEPCLKTNLKTDINTEKKYIKTVANESSDTIENGRFYLEGSYDDMTINQEVMSGNDGLRSYDDITPELHNCTIRQHDQSSHLLDYEPCLKTNLKTIKDNYILRHEYDVRHKYADRKGSYVDMKVKSYVDMTAELHNRTTINHEQASSTAEFEPLLNTGLKKVKENVLYVQPKDSENTTATGHDRDQVHFNDNELSDRDNLSSNQEKTSHNYELPKNNQEGLISDYQVYLMWRDSIFGQKDIQFQDWLEMKQTRSRDGP